MSKPSAGGSPSTVRFRIRVSPSSLGFYAHDEFLTRYLHCDCYRARGRLNTGLAPFLDSPLRYLSAFKKQYKKLSKPFQDQFDTRLALFLTDPTDPRLRVHPLKGAFAGYWSMNVNGDLRALYRHDGDEIVIFALIGTHSERYG